MKKIPLLLLAILISLNVFGESFHLVCDGKEEVVSQGKNYSFPKVTQTIKVDDKSLFYDGWEIKNYKDNNNNFVYEKTKNDIYFLYNRFYDKGREMKITGTIDRISGVISVKEVNNFTEYVDVIIFEGKCKKSNTPLF